ncbi:MAG: hypothetical protein J0M04_01610 [Verrucomicrobia bacterium]|nr:hypothetical protein [Verrucomicrobiota bacterium]
MKSRSNKRRLVLISGLVVLIVVLVVRAVWFRDGSNRVTRDIETKLSSERRSGDFPSRGGDPIAGGSRYHSDRAEDLVERYKSLNRSGIVSNALKSEASDLLFYMAEHCPDELLRLIEQDPKGGLARGMAFSLFDRIAGKNPELIVSWLETSSVSSIQDDPLYLCAMNSLASRIDNAKVREFMKMRIESRQDVGLCGVPALMVIGSNDPKYCENALRFINELKVPEKFKQELICRAAVALLPKDAEAAFRAIDGVRGESPPGAYSDFMAKAMAISPELVLKHLKDGTDNRLVAIAKLSNYIDSPDLAAYIIANLPITADTLKDVRSLVTGMLAKDPERAISLIDGIPDGDAKSKILSDSYLVADGNDKTRILEKIANQPTAQRIVSERAIAAELGKGEIGIALDYVDSKPADEQQTLYREIARSSAFQNHKNAINILEDPALSAKIGAEFRQEMLNATVTNWAKQDLSAARDWVEKLPEADAAKGYQGLMTSWMKTDPVAASEWLSKQALGPARDAGAKVLIEQIKDTDPERAEQWRKSLTPPAAK